MSRLCRTLARLVSLLLALLLAACGATQQAAAPTPASQPVPTSLPAPTIGPTAIPTPAPGEFANPVISQDFPDPDVLKVGATYYAYATNFGSQNIQAAKSDDLVSWQILSDALPFLPDWAVPGYTWAPEVTQAADGLVMYFTARHAASGKQCIGAATSATPEGPFQPAGDQPLICQLDQGGSIDASSFVDEDGARYVLWKNDGNCCGQDTWLHIQPVSPDGLALADQPTQLVKQDQLWEGSLVEAPTLWKQGGTYYLFYSANSYAGADYAVGYAVADTILGPYQKAGEPLLVTSTAHGAILGPGGQDIVVDKDGETWIVYHSWEPRSITYRQMNLDELAWEGDRPVVKGPDAIPQPVP
jgi:arabinan endo-1,5-alpha-L-arabinosidase